jgi:hypothetical protein
MAKSSKRPVAPMTVDEAIKRAYEYCRTHADQGFLRHAATYLAAIPQAVSRFPNEPDHAKEIQISYALGNMSAWKGPDARRVKAVLKAYTVRQEKLRTMKPRTAKAALPAAKKRTA